MKPIKNNLGWIIILILSFIPAIIWLNMLPWKERFADLPSTLTSLGQLTGLIGMTLFAISLILSARLKFFDQHLHGLNRVYINHHRYGAIAFILLLFHPLLLASKYLIFSLESAMVFLLPSSDWTINFGILSLLGMIILLILTFFVSLRYDFWKNTHKYLGLVFFLGGLHSFLITSDISRSTPLRWYVLTLSALGILIYIYHTLLGKITAKRYLYSVEAVNKLNDAVVEVVLSPFKINEQLSYQAGQFAFVNFDDQRVGLEQHPFSFVSAPHEEQLRFAIKNLGDYTGTVSNLTKGTIAKIEGPYGQFSYTNTPNKKQIWVAGGIGITPFISMGMEWAVRPDVAEYSIDLYYCTKDEAELVLMNRLNEITTQHSNFRLIPFCATLKGRINAQVISDTSGGLDNKDIFVCGPPIMMQSLREQFIQLGIKKQNIHSEEFKF